MNTFAARAPESAAPARFTVEQFLRMIEMGIFPDEHVELVHGEIIQLSPAHSRHGMMISKALKELFAFLPAEQLLVDSFLRLDDRSLRAFDITVIHPGITPDEVLEPDQVLLGIEIAESSIARDLGEKKRHYASAGIANYMVVDLNKKRVILLTEPMQTDYRSVQEWQFGEIIQLPAGLGQIRLA